MINWPQVLAHELTMGFLEGVNLANKLMRVETIQPLSQTSDFFNHSNPEFITTLSIGAPPWSS